jgi:hypothetical protein
LWPDGKKYVGQFVKNKREGIGTMTFPDKTSFQGKWKQGKRHGKGAITDINGI